MRSILLSTPVATLPRWYHDGRMLVRTGASTLYAFVFVPNAAGVIFASFRKSTDNGLTWGALNDTFPANIGSGALGLSVWFDQWTRGDSGTKIHIWAFGSGLDDIIYHSLDTASDTLSSPVTVFNGASTSTGATNLTGCKARGGNLYVFFNIDAGTETGFYRSTDNGANWSSRTSPLEAGDDLTALHPGEHTDNQDVDLVFWDVSEDEISRKVYDDSGNSWSESSIATSMVDITTNTAGPQFASMVRHSDGALIVAAWNGRDNGTDDLKVYSVAENGTVTTLTDAITNTDDCHCVGLMIDQSTDRLTVFYAGKSDGSEVVGASVGLYYKYSDDDGSTWSAEQDSGVALANIRCVFSCPSYATWNPDAVWYQELNTTVSLVGLYALVAEPSVGGGGLAGSIFGGMVVR